MKVGPLGVLESSGWRELLALASPALLAVGVLTVGNGCGPSFQAIYEGNSHFEHCYALEENPVSSMRERTDCWRDWSEHYTFGQTRDRIHYATARYVALSQAPQLPTDEALMMAAPGMTPRESTISAPAPTNAFAPPPKVLEGGEISSSPSRPSEVPTLVTLTPPASDTAPAPRGAHGGLPASACGDPCARKYSDCKAGCAPAAAGGRAAKEQACGVCESSYRTCMRACFK